MKKRIAMLLAGAMVLTMLGACGAPENESTDNRTEQVQEEVQNKENDTQEDVSGDIAVWTGGGNEGVGVVVVWGWGGERQDFRNSRIAMSLF